MNNVALKVTEAAELLNVSLPTMRELLHRKHDPVPSFTLGHTENAHLRIPYVGLTIWANRQAGIEIPLKEVIE